MLDRTDITVTPEFLQAYKRVCGEDTETDRLPSAP